MTSADAITLVRSFARNAGDTSVYSDAMVTSAINFVGTRFCRKTRYVRTAGSGTLAVGSNAVTATLTSFHPSQLLSVFALTKGPLKIIEYHDILQKAVDDSAAGTPEYIAWSSATTAIVYPTPSAILTLSIEYWTPFNTTTYNLPDSVLTEILPTGATAILQHAEPDQIYGSASWQHYLAIEAEYAGEHYGAKVAQRNLPENE